MAMLNRIITDKSIIKAYGPKVVVDITFPPTEDRAKQSFKDECDINKIMERYKKTGLINFQQRFEPMYANVLGADFQKAMQVVADGKTMFAELPAHLRERFRNDPVQFLDFVQNPANRDEAGKLGLLKPSSPQGDDNDTLENQPRTLGTRQTGETHSADDEPVASPPETDRGTPRRATQPNPRKGTR